MDQKFIKINIIRSAFSLCVALNSCGFILELLQGSYEYEFISESDPISRFAKKKIFPFRLS